MLLDGTYATQDAVEAESIIVEGVGDVSHAAGTPDVERKAAPPGKEARLVPAAAAVFTEAHSTHIRLAILDAPRATDRLRLERGTRGGRTVAPIIGQLLGLAPLAALRVELVACAPHLDDGREQPVPLGRQRCRGKDAHLTPFEALALRVKLPMSAERRGLTGKRLHLPQQLRWVTLDLNDKMIAGGAGDLESFSSCKFSCDRE
jgi:hypothetical protein